MKPGVDAMLLAELFDPADALRDCAARLDRRVGPVLGDQPVEFVPSLGSGRER